MVIVAQKWPKIMFLHPVTPPTFSSPVCHVQRLKLIVFTLNVLT